ncbi:MAG TPA: translation elongation factor Ts [Gammaproteobacteria bacterium]|nr:translation elongation factor Ts [Gammaproteobacteria bacterium]
MADISATDVKNLRERTGAGMMECKKALVEANGDMALAEELIAKAGSRRVQKTADRTAAEGLILAQVNPDQKSGALIEVNCETDFVTRATDFKEFCQKLVHVVAQAKNDNLESIKSMPIDNQQTVEEARQALVAKIGENIQFRRAQIVHAHQGVVGSYVHNDRIGVLVVISTNNEKLAKDLAMHTAAMRPQFVKPEDVPQTIVEKEKEIFIARAAESGKPANIVEKMIEGQVKKFVNEICLIGQPFIKDPDKQISQLLKEHNTTVESMIRFEVGEGIEVVKKSFQEEVMEQARRS